MEREFEKRYTRPTPTTEQETIITYDKETDTWHFYSDNPVHSRKWEHLIGVSDTDRSFKAYHSETRKLIGLEGVVKGNVSISKKRTISEEQREEAKERMNAINELKKSS